MNTFASCFAGDAELMQKVQVLEKYGINNADYRGPHQCSKCPPLSPQGHLYACPHCHLHQTSKRHRRRHIRPWGSQRSMYPEKPKGKRRCHHCLAFDKELIMCTTTCKTSNGNKRQCGLLWCNNCWLVGTQATIAGTAKNGRQLAKGCPACQDGYRGPRLHSCWQGY